MHPNDRETLASKLLWRMRHGDEASIVRALQACGPIEDAETMQAVLEALAYGNVDVRESASRLLADSGSEDALGPLRIAAEKADDDEERRNHERAAGAVERRIADEGGAT